jgi:hypothetical protein
MDKPDFVCYRCATKSKRSLMDFPENLKADDIAFLENVEDADSQTLAKSLLQGVLLTPSVSAFSLPMSVYKPPESRVELLDDLVPEGGSIRSLLSLKAQEELKDALAADDTGMVDVLEDDQVDTMACLDKDLRRPGCKVRIRRADTCAYQVPAGQTKNHEGEIGQYVQEAKRARRAPMCERSGQEEAGERSNNLLLLRSAGSLERSASNVLLFRSQNSSLSLANSFPSLPFHSPTSPPSLAQVREHEQHGLVRGAVPGHEHAEELPEQGGRAAGAAGHVHQVGGLVLV